MESPATSRHGPDSWLAAPLIALSAAAIGKAISINDGALTPVAIDWISASIICGMAALLIARFTLLQRVGDVPLVIVALLILIVEFSAHLTETPGVYLKLQPDSMQWHHRYIGIAALAAGGLFFPSGRRWFFPLMLAGYLATGFWLIQLTPNPHIDVAVWHTAAYRALAEGISPYSIEIPNIYGNMAFYGQTVADNRVVHVGYPYPPLALLIGGLGQWIGGDYRYANLFALALSGALLAYARPSRASALGAAIFLFTPRAFFFLEQGWTEAIVVVAFSATLFCSVRAPRLLPWAFGVLLASKQYTFFVIPLLPLLTGPMTRKQWIRFALISVGLATAITLPFMIWDFRGFWNSVVMFQIAQPFRREALSYMASTARAGVPWIPQWTSFALLVVVMALARWRAPRSPSGFALGSALAFLFFFAFAKQAFANYYFMVFSLTCGAVAVLDTAPAQPAVVAPPGQTIDRQPGGRPLTSP